MAEVRDIVDSSPVTLQPDTPVEQVVLGALAA
jgi:hypothetical protein